MPLADIKRDGSQSPSSNGEENQGFAKKKKKMGIRV